MGHKIGLKIGEGGCSEVFEWENGDKIVKMAKPNTTTAALQNELHHCRIAWECGLPVPRPYELVTIEGRSGIVFERIIGESLMDRFVHEAIQQFESLSPPEGSEDDDGVRITARLLHQVHSHSVLDMPDQRLNIKHDIQCASYLSDTDKAAAIAQLDELQVKQQLCHGDPNPGNILIRDHEPVIIDWNNASLGNPEADLAEYIIMFRFAILPADIPDAAKVMLDEVREAEIHSFMEEYERLSGIGYHDIEPWFIPIMARKLSADGISEEEKTLLVHEIKRRLHQNAGRKA